MKNYDLTNQYISESYNQLIQKDENTGKLVYGTGSVVDGLEITGSLTASAFSGDGSGITNVSASSVAYADVTGKPTLVSSSVQVTLEDTSYTDNGESSFLQTDGAGTLSFQYVEAEHDTIYAGETVVKGDPLYISGSNGANPIVYKADAAIPSKMPVIYIADEGITAGTVGRGIILGNISGVNTTGFPVGTTIYVAEGGGWGMSRPTGSNSIVQVLGIVTVEGAGGQGLVLNPGPVELPNIAQGMAWVGDVNNQPQLIATSSFGTAVDTGSFATTGSNTFVGNQTVQSGYTSSFDTVNITGKIIVSQSQLFANYFNLADDASVYYTWPNGNAFNFQNGAVQWQGNGIGMFGDFSGFAWNGQDSRLSMSARASSFGSLNQTPYTGSIQGLFYNQSSDNNSPTNVVIGVPESASYDGHAYSDYSLSISGSLSASLQQGFVWVGDANGRTTTVSTGSFGGGGSTFPYTGDAQITGSLGVSNTITTQILLNPQTLTGTQTIPAGYNGMLTGPVSNAGTIVVETGSTLVII